MTLKGQTQLPKRFLKLLARGVQVHLDTHPTRLAKEAGVSANYVRQLWRQMTEGEMASTKDFFSEFIDAKSSSAKHNE